MKYPDYIVLRPSEEFDLKYHRQIPKEWNDYWYDTRDFNLGTQLQEIILNNIALAKPTGRFEQRNDGALAEIWEYNEITSTQT